MVSYLAIPFSILTEDVILLLPTMFSLAITDLASLEVVLSSSLFLKHILFI